jgi:hypothetical protein
MWAFMFGLILGAAGKAIYDLFKQEPLPEGMGLNTGRVEAMLDETRQSVRDLREEVRQVLSGEGTVQEKAGRLLSTASSAVKGGKATEAEAAGIDGPSTESKLMAAGSDVGGGAEGGSAIDSSPRSGAAPAEEHLMVTGTEGSPESGADSGAPGPTHGSRETTS